MNEIYNDKLQDCVVKTKSPVWVVKEVKPQNDYTLLITFVDGETKIYDFLPLLNKEIFKPLNNLTFFMTARADGCSVSWNDDIDIAPEELYYKGISVSDTEEHINNYSV
ncbi:MAG: DUF2442 domain-containing protein [Oscillospiraceae bacterium]|nr:DUF2442 domain-containing protein [Oscillospiraceae bacterium]